MEEKTMVSARTIINYLKYVTLSFLILFIGLLIVPTLCSMAFREVLTLLDQPTLYTLFVVGPWSLYSWFILFFWVAVTIWPFVAFIVWAVVDSRKFAAQGIKTSPFLWGLGMLFPIILIVFPLYLVRRNITWQKEEEKSVLTKWSRPRRIFFGVVFLILVALSVVTVLRIAYVSRHTPEQVAKIHATKLTMDDVMGVNLPPDPGAEADKTVAGIDANANGIRDDVELAIFKEYPNSAKTRAVLLQYALALQTEMTLPILNTETATAVVEDIESRADVCIWSLSSRADMDKFMRETEKNENFVKNRQINTEERREHLHDFYKYVGSYSASNDGCDVDISVL